MREIELIEQGVLSRYDLSYYSFRQLQRDHINFEQQYTNKFSNGFICRILINYMDYAKKNFLKEFNAEISERLKHNPDVDYFRKGERITFTIELTKIISGFDFIKNEDFKKRIVITYILEKFTALPLSDREKIYFSSQYDEITKAMDSKELLLITTCSGKEFEVKPYALNVDENSMSYYLIGYSRPRYADTDFELHSYKLSRISSCSSRHTEFNLLFKEIKNAKEISEKFGAAYMVSNLNKNEIENTVVRLTKKGYMKLYLKTISRQRPIPVSEPTEVVHNGKKYYELVFDCSHRQIRNYFFSFGKEAEIISPKSLRDEFIKDYKEAYEQYCKND